ncbi:MAG: hypothetical protein WBW72_02420 [Erwinia billingiae]
MNILKRAWLCLTTKHQKETPVTDITASEIAPEAASAVQAVAVDPTPIPVTVGVVKTGVKDFEAAFAFVEAGVAQLGDAAKDELKALAQKYL